MRRLAPGDLEHDVVVVVVAGVLESAGILASALLRVAFVVLGALLLAPVHLILQARNEAVACIEAVDVA